MPLTKCWSCGRLVSTNAHFCPNAKCVAERPWDPAAAKEPAQPAGRSRRDRDPQAIIEALAAELVAQHDPRSVEEVRASRVTCSECKKTLALRAVLGRACTECGNPWVIICEMPGKNCHRPPTQLSRVSGLWLTICRGHKVCDNCGDLIDEVRFESRTKGPRPAGMPSPGTQGAFTYVRNGRNRIHKHADPHACKAIELARGRVE